MDIDIFHFNNVEIISSSVISQHQLLLFIHTFYWIITIQGRQIHLYGKFFLLIN